MKKTITAVAVLALSGTLAFAAPGSGMKAHGDHMRGPGGHGMRGDFAGRFAEKLNLTDAQKQQMQQLRERFRAENEPLRAQFKQNRADMKAARDANDTARLDSLKGTADSLRAQMKERRTAQHEQMMSILSADQKAKLDALKAERQSRRGEHGRHGKRHGNR